MFNMIYNGIIRSTFLGFEEHGIFTFSIGLLLSDGVYQDFGGITLDAWSEEQQRRVAHVAAGEFIMKILDVVGVHRWEELIDKPVRVVRKAPNSKLIRLGNFMRDEWVSI